MGRNLGKPPTLRLQKLIAAYGAASIDNLAFKLGLPAGTVRNWHARDSVPELYLRKAAYETNRSFDYFSSDRLSVFFDTTHIQVNKTAPPTVLNTSSDPSKSVHIQVNKTAPPTVLVNNPTDANRVSESVKPWPQDYSEADAQPCGIPVFNLGVSAGAGGGMQPGLQAADATTEVFFTPSYMRRHFGRAGNGFAMVYVKGDSMQPTLFDGDEIVIDTRVQRVDRDGIYVFMLRGDIKVKRIQAKLDGSLLVKSDNGAYETEQVGAGHADRFQVHGRLVWPRFR
jgi:phage repressor protein C with HTH and peptisase S24 domain